MGFEIDAEIKEVDEPVIAECTDDNILDIDDEEFISSADLTMIKNFDLCYNFRDIWD